MTQTLGAASTRWTDYLGSAAADDADALPNTRSIYELSGIDRDRWTITAVDLFFGRTPQVAVYATPAVASAPDQAEHVAPEHVPPEHDQPDDGPLAVTQFRISSADQVAAFLDEAFRTVAVRLVGAPAQGREIVVTDVVAL